MHFQSRRLADLGAYTLILSCICIMLEYDTASIIFGVSGIVTCFLSLCVLPGDYYPLITRQIFSDKKTFEEFRDSLRLSPDMERIVWYVYNLPPDDFLNFIRLLVELRDASNQEGLRRIANAMRGKPNE